MNKLNLILALILLGLSLIANSANHIYYEGDTNDGCGKENGDSVVTVYKICINTAKTRMYTISKNKDYDYYCLTTNTDDRRDTTYYSYGTLKTYVNANIFEFADEHETLVKIEEMKDGSQSRAMKNRHYHTGVITEDRSYEYGENVTCD